MATKAYEPAYFGGKGAGLLEMRADGLSIPAFAILSTEEWRAYATNTHAYLNKLAALGPALLTEIKGDQVVMPLVSVRSGAPVSMPGMMDTLLNMGIDDETYSYWEQKLGKATAMACLRRLMNSYIKLAMEQKGILPNGIKTANKAFAWFEDRYKFPWPKAAAQVFGAIVAVFNSWDSPRAKAYRAINNIPHDIGTAVIIQQMVFGNLNDKSCTGVLFTRNPDTGDKTFMGEFLVNAQGEDVVAGTHTPQKIDPGLYDWNPDLHIALSKIAVGLEASRGYPQDIEFTVEDGKLWILQTRNIKRSARAGVKIALDMIAEQQGDSSRILKTVTAREYMLIQQPCLEDGYSVEAAAIGLPASSGVAQGKVVHTSDKADAHSILVRDETDPSDIEGMHKAAGILTMNGGATSHAAVIARGMNKPAVVGLGQKIEDFPEGTIIAICGSTGRVWRHGVPIVTPKSQIGKKLLDLAYDVLQARPIAHKAIAGDQVIDLRGAFLMDATAFQSNLAAIVDKVDRGLILHDPTPEQTELYELMGIRSRHRAEMIGVALENLTPEQQDKIQLMEPRDFGIITDVKILPRVASTDALVMAEGAYVLDPNHQIPAAVFGRLIDLKGPNAAPVSIDHYAPGLANAYLSPAVVIEHALGS